MESVDVQILRRHIALYEVDLLAAGDLKAGLMLSQIVYYFGARDGKRKTRVKRGGRVWLVRTCQQWQDELHMGRAEVTRCIAALKNAGLIETAIYKYRGLACQHVRLIDDAYIAAIERVCAAERAKIEVAAPEVDDEENDSEVVEVAAAVSTTAQARPAEDGFTECWEAYPRKRGKAEAHRSYTAAIKAGAKREDILAGVQRFAIEVQRCRTEERYIPHGSTWFAQRRWEDTESAEPAQAVDDYDEHF